MLTTDGSTFAAIAAYDVALPPGVAGSGAVWVVSPALSWSFPPATTAPTPTPIPPNSNADAPAAAAMRFHPPSLDGRGPGVTGGTGSAVSVSPGSGQNRSVIVILRAFAAQRASGGGLNGN